MRHARTLALFALRESVRRRVFLVVAILTVAFLALYGAGAAVVFHETAQEESGFQGVDTQTVVGSTLLGLAMFGTLFLGTILAVFLTLGAVRGDAERGLLQPVLVRPVRRRELLLGRYAGAVCVCAPYVIAVFVTAAVLTKISGGYWPDRIVLPALGLAGAVSVVAAISLAGSVVLASTANGIAVFMVFGAGLVAGLLGQIAEALNSHTLDKISTLSSWALPFEALYQRALADLTADSYGFTRLAVQLGPFGGAQDTSPLVFGYALLYIAGVGVLAHRAFAKSDL